jgi:hypothetical protein
MAELLRIFVRYSVVSFILTPPGPAVIAVWFTVSWVCMHLSPKPPVSERDMRCGSRQGSTAMTARNQPAVEDSLDAITDAC